MTATMLRRPCAALLLALTCLPMGACGGDATPQPSSPDVWAIVNGREIRRDAVEKYYRGTVRPDAKPSAEEALNVKLNILNELITNEILLDRARAEKLEATDAEVEDKLNENKRPFTEEQFQRQLAERSMTVDDYRQELRRELTIDKLINREVLSKVTVTDQDLADYYNANREQFDIRETQYRLAQIVVTDQPSQVRNRTNSDAGTPADAQRKAQLIMERLQGGGDFAELAMDYSEDPQSAPGGGDLGYVAESTMAKAPPELRQAVLKMKPGDVNLITKDGMYTILLLVGREAAGQRELSDPQVSEAVRTGLRNRREQLLRSAYMSTVREGAEVTNFLALQIIDTQGRIPGGVTVAPPPGLGSQPGKD
jgi:peptidyl-prolyl cis-trans isomerase SurA